MKYFGAVVAGRLLLHSLHNTFSVLEVILGTGISGIHFIRWSEDL